MGTTSRTSISFARLPERDFNYDDNDDERNMSRENNRPELVSRPSDGRAAEPLLKDDAQSGEPGERGRSNYEVEEQSRRRHQMRSQSPKSAASKHATRKKYIMAGVFLLLSLFTFVVQTEIAVYIQSELDWRKPYFMLSVVPSLPLPATLRLTTTEVIGTILIIWADRSFRRFNLVIVPMDPG